MRALAMDGASLDEGVAQRPRAAVATLGRPGDGVVRLAVVGPDKEDLEALRAVDGRRSVG